MIYDLFSRGCCQILYDSSAAWKMNGLNPTLPKKLVLVPAITYPATRIGHKFCELDAQRIHKSSSIFHRIPQNDWTSLYADEVHRKTWFAIMRINPRYTKVSEWIFIAATLTFEHGCKQEIFLSTYFPRRVREILKEYGKPETMGK